MNNATDSPTPCGCCTGIQVSTPTTTANRPGLDVLSYRVGTYGSFVESMHARLSSKDFPALADLKTRDPDDPSLALIDAWGTVADVLTFYNERNVNEGYLRTATERRSVLEMARLVGYQPRPGVAANVFLAYTIDDNTKEETVIPKDSRSQSIPGPGELPQSFETAEALRARSAWNNLKPRIQKPQNITWANALTITEIYVEGISINLKVDDHLLFVFKDAERKAVRRVKESKPLLQENKTKVVLQPVFSDIDATKLIEKIGDKKFPEIINNIYLGMWRSFDELKNSEFLEGEINDSIKGLLEEIDKSNREENRRNKEDKGGIEPPATMTSISERLLNPSEIQPRNKLQLEVKISEAFKIGADAAPKMLLNLSPALSRNFYKAWETADISTAQAELKDIYVMRVTAQLFGHNAPVPMVSIKLTDEVIISKPTGSDWPVALEDQDEKTLFLDGSHEGVLPGDFALVEKHNALNFPGDLRKHGAIAGAAAAWKQLFVRRSVHTISSIQNLSRPAYGGVSGKAAKLEFADAWRETADEALKLEIDRDTIEPLIRRSVVRTQCEVLPLAQEPVTDNIGVCSKVNGNGSNEDSGNRIELAELHPGLEAGRWLIVSGERSDIPGTTGIMQSELVMLANVEQGVREGLPNDRTLSTITLAKPLSYCYKRETVKIFGNVVKATHGEIRSEALGSGDASKSLQSFTLKQPPLTYLSSPNPAGVESTLHIYVNDLEWHETDSLAVQASDARVFVTQIGDDAATTIQFGNGKAGSRLPTGLENIKAKYRNGIGKGGNVNAGQISLLVSRPHGVKEVVNPLQATGGSDKETRDQARQHAPLAVKALDRLVSVKDYEDFARNFAGIGKASAVELSSGGRRLVHITIAGADDVPLDENSDVYNNLRKAFINAGDPYQPFELAIRELKFIVISANIALLPDYQWESVVAKVRAAMLYTFSFERRELGQDCLLSQVISTMQSVPGVAFVDVDLLRGVPEKNLDKTGERKLLNPDQISQAIIGSQPGDMPDPVARILVNMAAPEANRTRPAQLAFITPDIEPTLILNQIP
jgi:hypothetical protein